MDLRAWHRHWSRRLPKRSRLLFHVQRTAELIEAVLATGPRINLAKRLTRAHQWMREHAAQVGNWQDYGAPEFAKSLSRAADCAQKLSIRCSPLVKPGVA